MSDNNIPRATEKIPPDIFSTLLKITYDNKWLINKPIQLAELWNFCDTLEQKNLIKELLYRFLCLTDNEFVKVKGEIFNHVTQTWGIKHAYTKMVAIADKSEIDGSAARLYSLKSQFAQIEGWEEKHFRGDFRDTIHKARNGQTIILFDDFIGTGKTIKGKLKWVFDILSENSKTNVTIKVLAFCMMEEAKSVLDTFSNIEYYAPITLKKGITDYYQSPQKEENLELMTQLESKLASQYKGWRLSTYNLGYKKSEALFVIGDDNIPNNVFPIFWWRKDKEKNDRNTLFNKLR